MKKKNKLLEYYMRGNNVRYLQDLATGMRDSLLILGKRDWLKVLMDTYQQNKLIKWIVLKNNLVGGKIIDELQLWNQ